MALSKDLEIYKAADALLAFAMRVQTQVPRAYRVAVGQKVCHECVEILLSVARANAARGPSREQHIATFPPKLIEHCILAGARSGGIVLDIFMGSGTTAQVAEQLGRKWIGIDLDQRNEALQRERLRQPSLDLEAA